MAQGNLKRFKHKDDMAQSRARTIENRNRRQNTAVIDDDDEELDPRAIRFAHKWTK